MECPRIQVSKSPDMIAMAKHLLEVEKQWLLSQIGKISIIKMMTLSTIYSCRPDSGL